MKRICHSDEEDIQLLNDSCFTKGHGGGGGRVEGRGRRLSDSEAQRCSLLGCSCAFSELRPGKRSSACVVSSPWVMMQTH